MTENGEIKVRLFCFDPKSGNPPHYDVVSVPRKPDMRILDVLNHVYDTSESDSLAIRWYCGTKKCGACAVSVNGTPMLSCWEPAQEEMTLEPLANFLIIRDLVVDIEAYERMLVELQPILHRTNPPDFPEKISQSRMSAANHLLKCIECNVCTAAIPAAQLTASGIDWSGYAGPGALVRFARYVLDPRDELDRKPLADKAGLEDFPQYEVLRAICPQAIDIIDDALAPAREKLYGERGTPAADVATTTPLIVAPSWAAFVRLTDESKQELQNSGQLQAQTYSGIDEAYVMVDR